MTVAVNVGEGHGVGPVEGVTEIRWVERSLAVVQEDAVEHRHVTSFGENDIGEAVAIGSPMLALVESTPSTSRRSRRSKEPVTRGIWVCAAADAMVSARIGRMRLFLM